VNANMTADPPPILYLIRHGQTAWSLSGQHTGVTDIPLTAYGEDEVRALVPWLRDIAFAHVLTSPLLRARQTCILAGLADSVVIEPDLTEWNYGQYEGLRTVDIRRDRPDWAIFRDGAPGGESPEQTGARADRLIGRLSALSGNIALFTHGQFACSLATRWIGLDIVEGAHLALNTATLSILGHNPSTVGLRVIGLWNAAPGRFADRDPANR